VNNEESVKAIEKVQKIAEEKNIKIIIDLKRQSLSVNKCGWPIDNIFVDVEGNVYPCCNIGVFFAEGDSREKFSFGNILREDANEIWKGKQYHQLRKMMMQNKAPAVCKMSNCLYVQPSKEK
jgi:radical SAM protein with 4Fe4S-binding SPASM domain